MSKKFSFLVGVSLLLVGFLSLASDSKVLASWLLDRSGTLVQVDPLVLGENDSRDGEAAEDTNESGSKTLEVTREREKKALEIRTETAKKNLETQTEARKKTLELNRQTRQSELEIKDKKLKVKQELRDQAGKVIRKTELELPENESLKVEREDGAKLEVKAGEGAGLEINGNKVRTRTNFPITIGEDNALIITKKDGTQKIVTYLPDAAVANLEAKGFITASSEAELEESDDGAPVYKFKAEEEKRVLGLFRRKFQKQVEVSAETGEIVKTSDETSPLLERFIARLAF